MEAKQGGLKLLQKRDRKKRMVKVAKKRDSKKGMEYE
jgi:hypothetical protein